MKSVSHGTRILESQGKQYTLKQWYFTYILEAVLKLAAQAAKVAPQKRKTKHVQGCPISFRNPTF